MQIPGKRRGTAAKWLLSLTCLLIVMAGISVSHYRTLNAHSPAVATPGAAIPDPVRLQLQMLETRARTEDKLATQPSIWPVSGTVTSGFSWRQSPWGEGREFHQGIDIAVNLGTPVVAAADGRVVQSEWAGGYGNVVQIDHGNGIVTIYGHNASLLVQAGQNVKKGQVISLAGSSGKSTGPHVHYEVRVNGAAVDPTRFLLLP